MPVDLHLHTVFSDGSWTPTQLVEEAIKLRFQTIAVTDHDTVNGIEEAQRHACGRLEVIPGIEINTVWINENGREEDVHILGYFIDGENEQLRTVMQKQQHARIQLVEETAAKLQEAGLSVTADDIRACAGSGSIGRPHITKAIVKHGGAADVNEAYDKYMRRESPHYVARKSVGPAEAIAAIRAAGGIASLAHPGMGKDVPGLVRVLKEMELQAMEAFHRSHSLAQIRTLMRLAKSNGLIVTGGSDCHGPYLDNPASIGSVRVPLHVVQDLRRLIS